MNSREKGFLLLSSHLGDPNRHPLTAVQLRTLGRAVAQLPLPEESRELRKGDLLRLGCSGELAERILTLLDAEELADAYCTLGKTRGCVPVTRVSTGYPVLLRQRLGLDSPGCLWAKGDLSLLEKPAIALVGSRDLREANRVFARRVGEMAAENGWVLVSGNARGADRTGQEACLSKGGQVISVVADRLLDHPNRENVLYLSEDGFGEDFSSQRALSRNRCIHALGCLTFVAQCTLGKGGTWSGTAQNLRRGYSNVLCFRDGSAASRELERLGAFLLTTEELKDFRLPEAEETLFDLARADTHTT